MTAYAGAPARATVALPETETGPAAIRSAVQPPDTETALTVRAALAQLPDEQRIPLILLDIEGYSVAEIAKALGVAEGTVKSRCARGRAKLAIALGTLDPGRRTRDVRHGNPDSRRGVGLSGDPIAGEGGVS